MSGSLSSSDSSSSLSGNEGTTPGENNKRADEGSLSSSNSSSSLSENEGTAAEENSKRGEEEMSAGTVRDELEEEENPLHP